MTHQAGTSTVSQSHVTHNGNGAIALPTSANGWPLRAFQIVSLYEMLEFLSYGFYDMTYRLRSYVLELEGEIQRRGETAPFSGGTDSAHLRETLERVRVRCEPFGMTQTINRVFSPEANHPGSLGKALWELNEIEKAIRSDLSRIVLMYVPDDKAKYLEDYRKNHKLGILFDDLSVVAEKRVSGRFPEATEDISMSGNCFGIEANMACVFHLMRVAEYGLRHLAGMLKVRIKNRGKFVPIEEGTWNDLITACENKIKAIRQTPVGVKRRQQLALYSDAGQHCLFMKDIWRNSTSHTQQPYTASEAMAAFERVRDFMRFLAVNGI